MVPGEYRSDNSYKVEIFIGGDSKQAELCCQDFCTDVGLCVTVTPTTYVYKHGKEQGVIVGLINYRRFPAEKSHIWETAKKLGEKLCDYLCQGSYTIQDDQTVLFHDRRDN